MVNFFKTLAVATLSTTATVAFLSTSASALTWNLQNVQFDDGGTATGFFNYDASTNTYDPSNFELSVAGGDATTFPSFTYSPSNSTLPFNDTANPSFVTFESTSGRSLIFNFDPSLTNSGGTVSLVSGSPDMGSMEVGSFTTGFPARNVVAGQVSTVTTTVPEPSTDAGLLVLGALGAATVLKRKLKQQSTSCI